MAAACISPWVVGLCDQAGDWEACTARLSSAQVSDGSGHAAQDYDVTERSEREEGIIRIRAEQCFNGGPREGDPTTPRELGDERR